jgi:hypothetical protein
MYNDNEFDLLDINSPMQRFLIKVHLMALEEMHERASWAAKQGWMTRRAQTQERSDDV